jgi:D-glycero-D-manno-heptose 1,7-bisphosphate phosphatase
LGASPEVAISLGKVGVLRRSVAESIERPCSVEEQVYPALLARGALVGIPFSNYFIDIGIPGELARARRELPTGLRRPLALLDRDGVINVDHGYVHRVEDFEWLPGIADAIRLLNDRGYRVAIITNQAGIAKGYYGAEEFHTLTDWMLAELLDKEAVVNGVYHCPHHPLGVVPSLSVECDCRKPRPGMLLRAMADLMADPQGSFVLGDKDSDVLAATAAGIRGYLHDGRDNVLSRISEILDEVSGHEVARG